MRAWLVVKSGEKECELKRERDAAAANGAEEEENECVCNVS